MPRPENVQQRGGWTPPVRRVGDVSITAWLVLFGADVLIVGPVVLFLVVLASLCEHGLDAPASQAAICSPGAGLWAIGLPVVSSASALMLVLVPVVRRSDNWGLVFLGWALTAAGVIAGIWVATNR